MDYRHLYASEPRITLASILLLAVFVSAAAFIVSAIVWQPWNADGATVITPSIEGAVIVEPVSDELSGDPDVLVQPAIE